jgi:hypothetical protein
MVRISWLGAADTRSAAPATPVHSAIPAADRDIAMRHRSLAAQFKKASLITIVLSELPLLKIAPPFTVFVDNSIEENFGAKLVI